jgi:hypothetical protein
MDIDGMDEWNLIRIWYGKGWRCEAKCGRVFRNPKERYAGLGGVLRGVRKIFYFLMINSVEHLLHFPYNY